MAEREIDREKDRKKKEQESAEAISGLKISCVFQIFLSSSRYHLIL